ncbi:MAG: leucine-rich repeat protein [Clostridia bacterium]|nr:leucine-rich repeat protein [Clostridia bacterium]
MKKIKGLLVIIAVIVMMLMFSVAASAVQTPTSEKYFSYSIVNGEACIYRIDRGFEGHFVIPEKLKGYPVTEVKQANYPFDSCGNVTAITLPSTIKRVGQLGLSNDLEKVYVDSLETWLNIDFIDQDRSPFSGGGELYIGGELASEIVIPEGVTEIKDYAFQGMRSVKSIKLPLSLEILGTDAFECDVYVDNVESWINLIADSRKAGKTHYRFFGDMYVNTQLLVDLVIPESVTELPAEVFNGFGSIKSVTFHKSFEKVDQYSFFYCTNIKEVYVPDVQTWFNICTDMMRTINMSIDTIYVDNKPLVDLVIPESIDTIPDYAFEYYSKLESISISAPIKKFGYNWNYMCDNFKSIYVDSYETWMDCDFVNGGENPASRVECLYIDGAPVIDYVIPEGATKISSRAFVGYKGLKSITIPSSIEALGDDAFKGSGLENVYVESLEAWFETCRTGIESSEFSWKARHPMSVAKNFYVNGEKIVDLVIPENITRIPALAFLNVKTIESVTFHKGITGVGGSAFSGCTGIKEAYAPDFSTWSKVCGLSGYIRLETIYIDNEPVVDFVVPEGVEKLPAICFNNYNKLESITIGSSLKEIGGNCFTGCDNLKNVYVDSLNTWLNLKFVDETANPMKIAENLYIAGKSIENLVIDENVTSIPAYAFADFKDIKSVTIHDKLTSIGKDAFAGCTNIESVYVPSLENWLNIDFESGNANPLSYGAKLYIDGEFLEVLEVPEEIGLIKQYAFYGYAHIKTFNITGAPLSIDRSAFYGDRKQMEIHAKTLEDWLIVGSDVSAVPYYSNPMQYGATLYINGEQPEEIVIPESVKRIPAYAFNNYKKLKKVTIPVTTKMGLDSLKNSGLEEIIIGSLTTEYEPTTEVTSSFFGGCSTVKKVILGYGVKSIGDGAFRGRSNLKEVVMYSGLEKIGVEAFYNSGITAVIIPSTVKEVGKFAFAYCGALESVTFGDKVGTEPVMNMDDYAFKRCPKLKTVIFNSGVKKIGRFAFDNSFAIKDVYVNDLVTYLCIEYPGDVYDGQYSNPTRCADNIYIDGKIVKNLVIPEGVTKVACNAFYNIKSLETVKFPSTLKEIGSGAFASCWNLKDFTFPESLETIGEFAFFGCTQISKLELKKNVKSVGMSAFDYCTGLKTVYMYPQMLGIAEGAFCDCKNIELILYTGTKEAWDKLLKENKNTGLEGVAVLYRFRPESMRAPEAIYSQQTTDSVTLSWTKINGASGYKVFVKEGSGWKNLKTLKDNTYKVTGLKTGTRYTFAVRAYISSGAFVLWAPEYTTHDTATRTVKPSKVTATTTTSSIKLTWPKTAGATGYRIFYKTANGWSVCVSSTTATAHTFNNLKSGLKFTLAVRPYISTNSGIVWSDYTQVSTATQPVKPASVTASQTTSTLKLSWTPCSGATGYRIFRKSGNNWTAVVNNVTAISYSFKNLRAGSKFTLAVRPYIQTANGVVWGAYTQITTATLPANVTAKVTTPAKGRVTLTWNAVSGADSYLVYYRVGNGAYQLYKTCTGVQNITFNNLKSGAKYTFAVRAITKTSTGNIYGGYNAAAVTVK